MSNRWFITCDRAAFFPFFFFFEWNCGGRGQENAVLNEQVICDQVNFFRQLPQNVDR